MAKILVGSNLNTFGDAGQFEADRSTWGFGDGSGYPTFIRSGAFKTAGLYSALVTYYSSQGNSILMPCRFTFEPNKFYILKAKVRVPSSNKVGADATKITLSVSLDNLGIGLGIQFDLVEKTVLQATDAWVDIECSVQAGDTPFAYTGLNIRADGALNDGGQIYVDQFEVYQYIEDDEPEEPEDPETVEEVYFSRNPIVFEKSATGGWEAMTNYRLYDDVRVEDEADSGVYVSKLKTALPPESNGKANFLVRAAFRKVLNPVPPAYNHSTIDRLTDRIKRFKHFTGQLIDDQVEPLALLESAPYLALHGGLSKYAWPTLQFFTSYLPAQKKFMTWAPVHKAVDRNQEDYLNYFVFLEDTAQLKLIIKAYFDDGTNQTSVVKSKVGVQYRELYILPAGPVNSGALLINPAKNLIYYELWLQDQGDVVISEVRTYVIDQVGSPNKRFFLFLDSLGTHQVIRFTGQAEYSTSVSKEQVIKFLPHSYTALDGEKETNNAKLQESGSYSSGLLDMPNSAAWLDYLKDFLISGQVYDVTDGKRRPVQIYPGTFPTGADQNYERFIRFTLVDSYEDENYTPKL